MLRSLSCCTALALILTFIGCSPIGRQVSALKSGDIEVRRNAAFQLTTYSQIEQEYLQQLIEATFDKDATVREFAIKAIGKMNPAWEGVSATIRRGLRDEDISVRRASASIFSTMNPVPAAVLFTLAETLGDKDSLLRSLVRSTFIDLGPIGVNALAQTCQSENEELRCSAVTTLGTIGCEAKRALPTLKEMLNDENEKVRSAAEESIKLINVSYLCTNQEETKTVITKKQ